MNEAYSIGGQGKHLNANITKIICLSFEPDCTLILELQLLSFKELITSFSTFRIVWEGETYGGFKSDWQVLGHEVEMRILNHVKFMC